MYLPSRCYFRDLVTFPSDGNAFMGTDKPPASSPYLLPLLLRACALCFWKLAILQQLGFVEGFLLLQRLSQ